VHAFVCQTRAARRHHSFNVVWCRLDYLGVLHRAEDDGFRWEVGGGSRLVTPHTGIQQLFGTVEPPEAEAMIINQHARRTERSALGCSYSTELKPLTLQHP